MKCWAKNVSPCCDTQSREHYISKGLFSDKNIYVENAPFLGGVSKEIGKASLTRNCLCKKHNERLSIYDEEAIHYGKSLKYCLELSLKRRNSNARKFSLHTKSINNDRFNRWFIKTYLGLVEFFRYDSAIDNDELAKLVYSETSIKHYLHIEVAMAMQEDVQIKESVSLAPLEKNEKTIGMQVELYGIRLNGVFSDRPEYVQKPIKIKFNEHKQGPSCLVKFV
ncbi:hypothetical protein [Pseudoalteromonas sp. bablab_jr010]|uniref:hypothetical protein n=1 Tax=Pseudoalteromonas sp. bablab_jr010 TaxID=2755063 RepID=UPI0018F3CE66|nr:hypothetical protein [Pseudoalteromonas sp. bablab_jr010]